MYKINLYILSFLSIVSVVFAQATDPKGLCLETGGKFYALEDCSPCPENAVCETCFTGCQCTNNFVFDDSIGCVNFSDLIKKATYIRYHGINPSHEESETAQTAMNELKAHKLAVTKWILNALTWQRRLDDTYEVMPYGTVLWELGPDVVTEVIGEVAGCPEEIQMDGLYVLEMCANTPSYCRDSKEQVRFLLEKFLAANNSDRVRQEASKILSRINVK